MKKASHGLTLALGVGLVLGSPVLISLPAYAVGQSAQTDNNIQAELQNSFKKYKNVQISVKNGSSIWKEPSQTSRPKKNWIRKRTVPRMLSPFATSLNVAGAGDVSDAQLQQKIVQKLQYDRVGYGMRSTPLALMCRTVWLRWAAMPWGRLRRTPRYR